MTVMLYQPADEENPEVWGMRVAYQIVDEGEVEDALANGWFRHPNDIEMEREAPGILDHAAKNIPALIVGLSEAELTALLEAEQAGKTRKGVITLLEEALTAPGAA